MYEYIFDDQDAKEAIKALNNYEIRPGRFLVVTKSVDNRRLWVRPCSLWRLFCQDVRKYGISLVDLKKKWNNIDNFRKML